MSKFLKISSQELLALLTPIILIIPNIALNFTEHLSVLSAITNIILPLGVYLFLTTYFRKIGITVWCLLPIMIYCGFQIVLLYLYGCSIIGVDMFLNVVTSNATEIAELLGNLIIAIGSLIIFYIPALVYASICISKKRILSNTFMSKWNKVGIVTTITGAILLSASYALTPDFSITNDIFPVNVSKNLVLAFKRHSQSDNYPKTSKNFTYNAKSTHNDSIPEIYVVVIGETSRAEDWQLLGYNRETNPELSKANNLTAMPKAFTQSATTHKSVPMLLSPLTANDFDSIANRKSVITAFKEAGFYTSFFSNQKRNHSYTEFFSEEADTTIYLPDFSAKQPYDEELIALLEKQIGNKSHNKQLIVLHTYGSHFNYAERYPASHSFFKPDSKTDANKKDRQQLVNAYDNTIRYIDYYLKQAIDTLNNTGVSAALLYSSDHGEDIYDDERGRFLHASPVPTYLQLHVPMIVWISDKFTELFPTKVSTLAANKNKVVSSTVSIYNTLIDLAGINTYYYDEEGSLASNKFTSPKLLFLSDRNEPVTIDSTTINIIDYNNLIAKIKE